MRIEPGHGDLPADEFVVLVDDSDRPSGTMEKLEAHRRGVLHRAVSVFVFDSRGEMLLQRRAPGKYHSPELWSNACCTHPRPGESVDAAAGRRLREEMGISCDLESRFSFVYREALDRGLVEHEFDHVLIGVTDARPDPDPSEVSEWRYVPLDALRDEVRRFPDRFTAWFRLCFERAAGVSRPP